MPANSRWDLIRRLRVNYPEVAQSGRWYSFWKRVWFTESHIIYFISLLFVALLTQFILDN